MVKRSGIFIETELDLETVLDNIAEQQDEEALVYLFSAMDNIYGDLDTTERMFLSISDKFLDIVKTDYPLSKTKRVKEAIEDYKIARKLLFEAFGGEDT